MNCTSSQNMQNYKSKSIKYIFLLSLWYKSPRHIKVKSFISKAKLPDFTGRLSGEDDTPDITANISIFRENGNIFWSYSNVMCKSNRLVTWHWAGRRRMQDSHWISKGKNMFEFKTLTSHIYTTSRNTMQLLIFWTMLLYTKKKDHL